MKTLLVGIVIGLVIGGMAGYMLAYDPGAWVHAVNFSRLYHTQTGEVVEIE